MGEPNEEVEEETSASSFNATTEENVIATDSEKSSFDSCTTNGVIYSLQNFPIFCEQFKDHENQIEKVLLVVNMPSGAANVKLELNSDGTIVVITYNWAKILYTMDDLFKNELHINEIQAYHPKIIALHNALERMRNKVDVAPQGSLKIKLPFPVQTSITSYKKTGIFRKDGSQILTAEFQGIPKTYNKKDSDATVTFE